MSRPKAIGTAAETAVVRCLNANGWPHAERRALRGRDDAGDITGTPGICWELKAGDAAHRASDTLIDGWMRDTELERGNAGADLGVLVLRRKGKGDPGDWWAYMWATDFAALVINGEHGASGGDDPDDFPVRMRLTDLTARLRAAGYGDATPEGTA